ncbi:MAG: hypothetical protein JWM77_1153 [Rhodospirillales bacterium]|nr:hypothetical protein [Rhodospirillales bacterium]
MIGFACTGTSYLLGVEAETELCARQRVVTSTFATRAAFAVLQMKRIVLVNPYPAELVALALAYWDAVGIEVAGVVDVQRADGASPSHLRPR